MGCCKDTRVADLKGPWLPLRCAVTCRLLS
jgi:hypothetical protein